PDARPEALDQRQPADQLPLDRPAGDREVLHRTLGLGPPFCPGRHPYLAHRVVLDPEVLRPGLAHTGSFDTVPKDPRQPRHYRAREPRHRRLCPRTDARVHTDDQQAARTRGGGMAGGTPGFRRELNIWEAVGISVALMAPSMAANINPQGVIGSVGRA